MDHIAPAPALTVHPPQPQGADTTPPDHCWTLPDGRAWCLIHRLPGGRYRMRFPDLADFLIHTDGRIDGIPTPGTDAPTLEHLYANQVLPAALSLQERPVFHASALILDGGAVAFLGESGRGKSTLGTFLARRGHPLLTDDGLELRVDENGIWALPNRPSVRLWEDSKKALLPDTVTPLPGVRYTRKQRFPAHGLLPFATQPARLRAAFFLGDGTAQTPLVTRLTVQQAHLAWVRHTFLLDIHDKATLARQFREVARLATAGLSYQLDYPRDYATLPAVEAAVLAVLRQPDQTR
jgi:hypothetical protein